MAICIATDTVEGVFGIGMGIFFGVSFSSKAADILLFGVAHGILFIETVSPDSRSFLLWRTLAELASDDNEEDIGDRGFLISLDSFSF